MIKKSPHTYETNVFINCPFDAEYAPLFESIIFTIYILGFTPRSSCEIDDGGVRLDKIVKLIDECKYGIHDISRTELDSEYSLPRFNMPFELGIDIGCRHLGTTHHCNKILLILDIEEHRFRIYLSDISGQDIKAHSNDSNNVIKIVRNWLRKSIQETSLPSASFIQQEYKLFQDEIERICTSLNLDTDDIEYTDFCHIIETWLQERKGSTITD